MNKNAYDESCPEDIVEDTISELLDKAYPVVRKVIGGLVKLGWAVDRGSRNFKKNDLNKTVENNDNIITFQSEVEIAEGGENVFIDILFESERPENIKVDIDYESASPSWDSPAEYDYEMETRECPVPELREVEVDFLVGRSRISRKFKFKPNVYKDILTLIDRECSKELRPGRRASASRVASAYFDKADRKGAE